MFTSATARRTTRLVMAALAAVTLVSLLGSLGKEGPFASGAGAQPTIEGAKEPTPRAAIPTTSSAVASTGPAVVYVDFFINDIQEVDLAHHRYRVDFYVGFRWSDPTIDPSTTFEFMNVTEQWGMTRVPASDAPIRLEDGSFYRSEHVQAAFKRNMPLEDYPFDTLDLRIIIEDASATTREVVYVADDPAVQSASDLSVPGYRVHQPKVTVADWNYLDFSKTSSGATSVSRIELSMTLTRPWLPYAVKIFIPLLVVILVASLVFLIDPQHLDARFGLGISSLLTLIALKWTTDGEIPLMDYLGLIDSLYILAFAFVAVGLAETTYTTWRRSTGADAAELRRVDRRTFVVASLALLVGTAIVTITHIVN